jgi:SAM domain (Sterile alpha motif)
VDIATWLRRLGLQQYEQAFRDNAIGAAVLPELTADDLKDLGVTLVWHRRKLLAAITALRCEDSSRLPAADKGGPLQSGGRSRSCSATLLTLLRSRRASTPGPARCFGCVPEVRR